MGSRNNKAKFAGINKYGTKLTSVSSWAKIGEERDLCITLLNSEVHIDEKRRNIGYDSWFF